MKPLKGVLTFRDFGTRTDNEYRQSFEDNLPRSEASAGDIELMFITQRMLFIEPVYLYTINGNTNCQ